MQEVKLKIGLEIHAYLVTKEKLFCKCKTEHKAKHIKPNTNICPVCTGNPGSKPMLPNKEAIKRVIQIGLMFNCKINPSFMFQRKHYNWPDLPKGYQDTISGAHSIPVCESGKFENIGIREVHLEEDPARWNPETGEIDYNRSGLPLAEIVTEPDFKSAKQVVEWLKNLLLTLSYIKAIDKDAGIKADVNVSTHGERVEIKNMNSIEEIEKAINYEASRQNNEREVSRETRMWDSKKLETRKMREKEQAEDYRFIPDPDLKKINIEKTFVQEIKDKLPESPQEKLEKLIKKHKIDKKNAEILYQNLEIVEFFEAVSQKIQPEFALPWVITELLRVLNWNKTSLDKVEINPQHFIELLELVKEKKITELKAKQILNDFVPKSFSPKAKLGETGRITDKKEIEKFCLQALKKNSQAVQDYKQGKQESLNFILGEIMKLSQRRADFKTSREILLKLLK